MRRKSRQHSYTHGVFDSMRLRILSTSSSIKKYLRHSSVDVRASRAFIMRDASSEYVDKITIAENMYYKDDMRYTMQLCRWMLTPIGVWPLLRAHVSKTDRILSILFLVICCGLFCFTLIPPIIQIFVFEKDINIKVKLIGPTCFCVSSAIKYLCFAWHRHDFKSCIDYVEHDWKTVNGEDDRAIMLKFAYLGRKITQLCAIFLYSAGMSYHTIIPLSSGKDPATNVTLRRFIYSGYDILFDSQASPTYEIVFFLHCFTAVVMYNVTTAACSLAAIFVTHACSRIKIIMARINNLVDDTCGDHSYLKNRIVKIVREHVNILRFSACVEKVLREICLFEVVVSSLTICLLEYHCMMEWENSDNVAISIYFMLLISLSFNIFIFCYIGELLVEQCSQIGQVCYENGWCNLPKKKALDLILMTVISQHPPKITAGKIFELSLHTFSKVLNTSFVYLNVLRTITE